MTEQITQKEILRAQTLYEDQIASLALVALNGINQTIINFGSTTTYEVFSGKGIMFVDSTPHVLEPGVRITVPRGTPYYDAGEDVVMWATSVPPFNINTVREIDVVTAASASRPL